MAARQEIVVRPEIEVGELGKAVTGDIARPLTMFERLSNMDIVRKFTVLLVVLAAWELYTRTSGVSELILPTFSATAKALVSAIFNESLLEMLWNSVKILLTGYLIGLVIAAACRSLEQAILAWHGGGTRR